MQSAFNKDPEKPTAEAAQVHRIRITLTSKNMKSLEKGNIFYFTAIKHILTVLTLFGAELTKLGHDWLNRGQACQFLCVTWTVWVFSVTA